MLPGGRERRVVHTREYDFHYREFLTARTAQEQARYRRAILRGFISRPHHEHLIHRQFGVMPVTSRHTEVLLEVKRCQKFPVNDLFADTRCILSDGVDGPLADLVASHIGPPSFQSIWHVHDVSRK